VQDALQSDSFLEETPKEATRVFEKVEPNVNLEKIYVAETGPQQFVMKIP